MKASIALRQARGRAGLSQNRLAQLSGVKQPAISRIECGEVIPRVDTLDRLLAVCGEALEVMPRLGIGIDRTVMHGLIRLSPKERLESAAAEAPVLEEFRPKPSKSRR